SRASLITQGSISPNVPTTALSAACRAREPSSARRRLRLRCSRPEPLPLRNLPSLWPARSGGPALALLPPSERVLRPRRRREPAPRRVQRGLRWNDSVRDSGSPASSRRGARARLRAGAPTIHLSPCADLLQNTFLDRSSPHMFRLITSTRRGRRSAG